MYFKSVVLLCVLATGLTQQSDISHNVQKVILHPSQIYETKDSENPSLINGEDGAFQVQISLQENHDTGPYEEDEYWSNTLRKPYGPHGPHRKNKTEENDECEIKDSMDDFPEDLFTEQQRERGAILLHLFCAMYCFTLLAVVCNDYFIPSVECICDDLGISKDVAAATFMAVATSCPELFTNVVSTFVTESDMGIGTIVGSALFNTLGVGALGGLAAKKAIPIDWWPLTRDCLIYAFNVSVLVIISWDGRIYWYEATLLLVLYLIYFIMMFQNERIRRVINKIISKCCWNISLPISGHTTENKEPETPSSITSQPEYPRDAMEKPPMTPGINIITIPPLEGVVVNEKDPAGQVQPVAAPQPPRKRRKSLWSVPEQSIGKKIWWAYTWPIKMLLTLTVPSPKTYRKLYPLTFIMCIAWIGTNSYIVFWMVSVMGTTFEIPDAVMGMTFLAAGGCLPEAISIIIMSRKGEGGMGVSNSLGANSLGVLFSLGVPWFIKTMMKGVGDDSFVVMDSGGIEYTILGLLVAVFSLYLVIYLGKFRLKKPVGVALMCCYLVLVVLAILAEMDIFFPRRC